LDVVEVWWFVGWRIEVEGELKEEEDEVKEEEDEAKEDGG